MREGMSLFKIVRYECAGYKRVSSDHCITHYLQLSVHGAPLLSVSQLVSWLHDANVSCLVDTSVRSNFELNVL